MRTSNGTKAGAAAIVAVAIIAVIAVFSGISNGTPNGSYGVVQNGGIADNKQVRLVEAADGRMVPQTLPQGSSFKWVGMWSSVYEYPGSDRYWRTDIDGAVGNDAQQKLVVPSQDGINLGVAGTFRLALNPDPEALGEFHTRFGIRPYADGKGGSLYPYDGEDGYNAYLAQTLPGLTQNVLTTVIGNEQCANLVPGCQLLKSQTGNIEIDPNAVSDPKTRERVQTEVNKQFINSLTSAGLVTSQATGSKPFFTNVFFAFERAELPGDLAKKVQDAKGKAAETAAANADFATAQARSNERAEQQRGFNACPVCADIERLRALPPGITTYAPGAGFAVGAGAR